MADGFITLRNFNENELIFDEAETKDILKFFFQHFRQRIDAATVTTELRNFAQGLLIEAIDATHALGYIDLLQAWFGYEKGAYETWSKKRHNIGLSTQPSATC